MASIKDAFEEAIQDNGALAKYFLFAIPVYYCTNLYLNSDKSELFKFWIASAITFIFLFGVLIECTTNVRNGKDSVLPSYNIFNIFWAGIKGLVALGPIIAINSAIAYFLCNYITNYVAEANTLLFLRCIICGVFGAIILTGYLCYARTFKILDTYNLKAISNSSMDILIAVIFMIPQILVADAVLIAPITYIVWIFFGIPHSIATFYWCMCLVFNLAMCGHYLAQVAYETIAVKENSDRII